MSPAIAEPISPVVARPRRRRQRTAAECALPAAPLVQPAPARTRPVWDFLRQREPTKREIRDRAYFIYLARGGQSGSADSDWLQAERELREELQNAIMPGRQ